MFILNATFYNKSVSDINQQMHLWGHNYYIWHIYEECYRDMVALI